MSQSSIIFQAHLTHRYESIIQIPGLRVEDFLRLCDKFNITLMDSEAFDSDMKTVVSGLMANEFLRNRVFEKTRFRHHTNGG